AGLIAPQVGSFLRSVESPRPLDYAQDRPAAALPATPPPSSPLPARDASAESLFRIASLLATTSDPAAATRLIAEEGSGLLPFDKLTFALRLTEGDRVILLEPGERRAFPDLPLIPVTGTALARVLQGQAPHAFAQARGESRLIVPLRVAGRVHGALVFSAAPPAALAESHLDPAQRLADIVAAHLELLRRAAMLPPPYVPGWKRAEKR
ncbi:MAG: GAF domain-containing protein, partial [Gemmatimonadales bacterium]